MKRSRRRRPPGPRDESRAGAGPAPAGAPGVEPAPWQAEELADAQAFIDREWAAHTHDTVHVHEDDWDVGEDIAAYIAHGRAATGLPRTAPCLWCRYCLADEARAGLEARRDRMASRREGTA